MAFRTIHSSVMSVVSLHPWSFSLPVGRHFWRPVHDVRHGELRDEVGHLTVGRQRLHSRQNMSVFLLVFGESEDVGPRIGQGDDPLTFGRPHRPDGSQSQRELLSVDCVGSHEVR